jgi:hypothetical protein
MPLTPEQISKLPKYARNEIARLTRDLEYLQGQLNDLNDPTGEVSWSCGGFLGDRHGLPSCAEITFRTPTGNIEMSLRDGGTVEVYGSSVLYIVPSATNHVHIKTAK